MADGEINRNGATIRIDDNGGVQVEPATGEEVEFTGPDTGGDATRDSVNTEYTQTDDLGRLKVGPRNKELFSNVGRLVDGFEDLSQWTVLNGSVSASSEYVRTGSQSAHLVADSNGNVGIERDDFNLDLKSNRLAIAVRAQLPGDEENFRVRVRGDGPDGSIQMRSTFTRATDENADMRVLNLGVRHYSGDVSRIDTITIDSSIDGLELWVDGLRQVPAPNPGKIHLAFDGQDKDIIDKFEPIFSEYGYAVHVGLADPEGMGEGGDMTWDDTAWLRDERGWTIGMHSFNNENSDDIVDYEHALENAQRGKQLLLENGHHVGAQHRSYLNGLADQDVIDADREHFLTARLGSFGAYGVPANLMTTNRVGSWDNGLDNEIEDSIDFAAELGGYTRIFGHGDDRVTEGEVRQVLDHIKEYEEQGKVEVVGIQEMYNEWVGYATKSESLEDGVLLANVSGPSEDPIEIDVPYAIERVEIDYANGDSGVNALTCTFNGRNGTDDYVVTMRGETEPREVSEITLLESDAARSCAGSWEVVHENSASTMRTMLFGNASVRMQDQDVCVAANAAESDPTLDSIQLSTGGAGDSSTKIKVTGYPF